MGKGQVQLKYKKERETIGEKGKEIRKREDERQTEGKSEKRRQKLKKKREKVIGRKK